MKFLKICFQKNLCLCHELNRKNHLYTQNHNCSFDHHLSYSRISWWPFPKLNWLSLAQLQDPFMMKALKRGAGTKTEPNMVPSAFESRMIGCVCEEDSTSIVWMWLHEGHPRRCECGHWFKIERKQPIMIPEKYMD